MKTAALFCLFSVWGWTSCSQTTPSADLGTFPSGSNNNTPVFTADLLKKLDWEGLLEFCELNDGFYAYVDEDSLTSTYFYHERNGLTNFKLVDYRGMVLEYIAQISSTAKSTQTEYFDKNVWIAYVKENLPFKKHYLSRKKLQSIQSRIL